MVSEEKFCPSASVDSIPTSANQEDHVSMGVTAARKAGRVFYKRATCWRSSLVRRASAGFHPPAQTRYCAAGGAAPSAPRRPKGRPRPRHGPRHRHRRRHDPLRRFPRNVSRGAPDGINQYTINAPRSDNVNLRANPQSGTIILRNLNTFSASSTDGNVTFYSPASDVVIVRNQDFPTDLLAAIWSSESNGGYLESPCCPVGGTWKERLMAGAD